MIRNSAFLYSNPVFLYSGAAYIRETPAVRGAPDGQTTSLDAMIANVEQVEAAYTATPTPADTEGANYGVLPPGGASVERATGEKRELMVPPESGGQLPHSVFFRTRKSVFNFDETDSGKMCYFNARYENAKGGSGPWSTMISAIIP